MPYPEWPDADIVFVTQPPPLDIPVLAEVWQHSRTLVLVGTQPDPQATAQALCEFFALPEVGAVLSHLRQQPAAVFFLSVQPRRWYRDWLPQPEHDAFVVDGTHFRFYFDAYTPHQGSFEFDDTYRRVSLKECTFAQSTNHFLHVLETLPYTAMAEAQMKRTLFQGLLPFYTGQPLARDVPFTWHGSPEPLRRAIIGEELKRHLPTYALALACLSEVGAAFTHHGRHDFYLETMGDLVQLHDHQVVVGGFTPEQRTWLRTEHPFLYLHVLYRLPNQFLIATMDEGRDALHHTALIAAAEDLLQRLVHQDSSLHFVKRTYELVALSGTLCQFKTFAARFHGDRPRLLAAKEDGLRAALSARADDVSRDLNYWMLAVLTDWVLFPAAWQEHTAEAGREYARLVEALRGHVQHEAEDYYNLMVAYLAAAVEATVLPETQIRHLLRTHGIGPETLTLLFQHPEYNPRRVDTYAVCLAAGYAALLCPTMGWDVQSLALPMAKAQEFFLTMAGPQETPKGVILRVIALKYAACRLFYLHTCGDFTGVAAEAGTALTQLHALAPHLTAPATLVRFFEAASAQPQRLDVLAVLRAVFTLPY